VVVLGAFAAVFALLPMTVFAANSDQSALEAVPANLTFPDAGSAAQTVTVTNRGGKAAVLGAPVVTTGFSISGHTCGPGRLNPGASCTVSIAAAHAGPFTGTLTIHDGSGAAVPLDLAVQLNIAPVPTPQGSVFLNPSSAPPASRVTFSGDGLPISTQLAVVMDGNHLADISTDGNGAFTFDLAIPDDATGVNHQICVVENYGNVCTGFTLEATPNAAPSPTDTATTTASPSPSGSPAAPVGTPRAGDGTSPLALLIKPPFVYLPIIAAIGLLLFLALYLWRARPTPPIGEVTILHKAPPPRVYEPQPDLPPTARAAAPPPPPVVYESPTGPAPASPPAKPPAPTSGADVPPDLPEASD
jgi:hypothetical protein